MLEENSSPSWREHFSRERLLYTRPVDDGSRMRAVANNLILHLHPTKVPEPALRLSCTWGLGGLSAMLSFILIVTGVLLMFRYDASVERAYASIQLLETTVRFGSSVRALHQWSATLLGRYGRHTPIKLYPSPKGSSWLPLHY